MWQLLQLKKLIAGSEIFFAGDAQCSWPSSRRDENKASCQRIIAHFNCCLIEEAGATMVGGDAGFGVSLLPVLGDGVGEALLEAHERRPVYKSAFC